MRRTKIALTSAVALPLALILAACGDDEADTDNASTDTSQVEETDDAAAEADEETDDSQADAGTAPAGEATAPGTELAIGEAALIPYEYLDETGDIELTLTAIEAGAPGDLDELDLGERADGYQVYYLRFTVTGGENSDAIARGRLSTSDVDGVLEDGRAAGSLIATGWDKCRGNFPDGFDVGVSGEVCVPVMAPEGAEVVGVDYRKSGSAYDKRDGEPLSWR